MSQYCSICGKKYKGYGNNAQPINNGRCCDECNTKIVVFRRIQNAMNQRDERGEFIDGNKII